MNLVLALQFHQGLQLVFRSAECRKVSDIQGILLHLPLQFSSRRSPHRILVDEEHTWV